MLRVVLIVVGCALLAGCNEDIKAQRAYQASTAAYKECLTLNGPQGCETQRLTMQADAQLSNSLTRAIKPY